jgi:membrane dipeptidase
MRRSAAQGVITPHAAGDGWSRRRLLRSGLVAGAGALAAPMLNFGRCRLDAATGLEVSTRAVDLVYGSTVVDMLGLLTLDWARLARWQTNPAAFAEREYRALERSGIRIFHPAVETSAREPHEAALRWTAGWNSLLEGNGCFLERVATILDLLVVPKVGRLGVVIGFQDSDHFRTASDVELFHRLGQRVSQLTYNEVNRLGSGCHVARDRGLTRFGAEVVAEMNRVGMVIDISHCGDRTSLDAVELSRQPVLITHSNCRALVPGQRRCRSDAVIRAMAKKGGVMGITVVRAFVGTGSPTLAKLLDHFDHVARIAGIEHVGLGSDADVAPGAAKNGTTQSFYAIDGLDPVARVFQITDGLLGRGYSDRDIALVLGGNFLRVLADIWPESSWSVVPPSLTRRDPFCPAPIRRPPF